MPIAGLGAELRRYNGVSWEVIAGVNSISGPNKSRTTIDTTALDTVGGYMTYIPGMRDPGSISLAINFDRDVYDTLNTDFESDTAVQYKIALPDVDNTTLTFSGYVTELPLAGIEPNTKVTKNVTIKITGQVTVDSGS